MSETTSTTPAVTADTLYADACKILGKQPLTIDAFAALGDEAQAFLSLHRITTVIKSRRPANHVFDWNNYDERKWYAWWDMETYEGQSAGSGFAFDGCVFDYAGTDVGSRLCSTTSADAKDIALAMIDDYRNWMKEN
jgi:hypothetical protein